MTLLGNTKFLGFLLQARLIRTHHIVGSWDFDPRSNQNIGILKCYETNVNNNFEVDKCIKLTF